MPSCDAGCAVAADERAERKPTVSPSRWAQTMPVPSLMSNTLLSLPSACNSSVPSVSTPSTSKRIKRTRLARSAITGSGFAALGSGFMVPRSGFVLGSWFGVLGSGSAFGFGRRTPNPEPRTNPAPGTLHHEPGIHRLKHVHPPQVVDVQHASDPRRCAVLRDHDRPDLTLLHDVQRLGGKRRARHGHGVARHHVAGGQIEDLAAALHPPPQVAVRDDAEQRVVVSIDDTGHAELLARHLVDH